MHEVDFIVIKLAIYKRVGSDSSQVGGFDMTDPYLEARCCFVSALVLDVVSDATLKLEQVHVK